VSTLLGKVEYIKEEDDMSVKFVKNSDFNALKLTLEVTLSVEEWRNISSVAAIYGRDRCEGVYRDFHETIDNEIHKLKRRLEG